jgi:hypothetical protein
MASYITNLKERKKERKNNHSPKEGFFFSHPILKLGSQKQKKNKWQGI